MRFLGWRLIFLFLSISVSVSSMSYAYHPKVELKELHSSDCIRRYGTQCCPLTGEEILRKSQLRTELDRLLAIYLSYDPIREPEAVSRALRNMMIFLNDNGHAASNVFIEKYCACQSAATLSTKVAISFAVIGVYSDKWKVLKVYDFLHSQGITDDDLDAFYDNL